jgi:hypothetical protein
MPKQERDHALTDDRCYELASSASENANVIDASIVGAPMSGTATV